MNRSGILSALIALLVLWSAGPTAAESAVDPYAQDTFYVCYGETVYDTFRVAIPDPSDPSVSMELLAGPGTLTWEVQDDLIGYYQYTPAGDTNFFIEYLVHTSSEDSMLYSQLNLVYVDEPPVIEEQYNSATVCAEGGLRFLRVYASDPEWQTLTYEKLMGPGTIDTAAKRIVYTADTAGVYSFKVAVFDDCGSDTAMVYDTITFNQEPFLYVDDPFLTQCEPGELCFLVNAHDPDGHTVLIDQVGGPGYTQTVDDSTVQTCFTPADEDSATYLFLYSYVDDCYGSRDASSPEWTVDTIKITVIQNRPPTLYCPGPQEFFTCVPDTFCFDVEATDPEFDPVTINILSGNAVYDNGTVCVYGDTSSSFEIVIEAVDDCGNADTCVVPVKVNGNRPPQVQAAADVSMTLCTPETICFSATIDDPDGDIASVETNLGTWNDTTDQVCFTADTAGLYMVVLTATDSCGAVDSDTTLVTVTVPELPVVDLGPDYDAYLCGASEVCLDVLVTADSVVSYVNPSEHIYTYDPQAGTICFMADTAGTYRVIFGVIGQCGRQVVDTADVTVVFPPEPFVDLGPDFTADLCQVEEICIDVVTVEAYRTLTPNVGLYDDQTGQLCFTPDTAGVYTLIVDVVDSCDLMASDTINVTVDINSPPTVISAADFEVALCDPDTICFEVAIGDPDSDLANISVSNGTIDTATGLLCFWAESAGTYEFVITATDSCGARAVDTTRVTVSLPDLPTISMPDPFMVEVCPGQEICFPVDITAAAGLAEIIVPTGSYDAASGQFCFTPEQEGLWEIEITAVDSCNHRVTETTTITVNFTDGAIVTLPGDFDIHLCEPEDICVDLDISGSYQSLSSNLGYFNADTTQLCFTPDTAGAYRLVVTAQNDCGSASVDTVTVTVTFNAPPVITPLSDTSIYLCRSEWVCLDLEVFDPDGNLASVTANQGTVTEDGRICFVPWNGGEYQIIVTATDSCGAVDIDTATVTVITDENVNLQCPGDTTIFTCSWVDTFCFPIEGIPDSAEVSVSGINTWFDEENQTVCYWSACGNTNRIRVTATTPCNTFECEFTVTVRCNNDPLVILPQDTVLALCESGQLCVPAGISDPDGNLDTVIVSGGAYNPATGRICVDLDGAGTYTVTATAIDTCGAEDTDQMIITVTGNTPPAVTISAPDTAISQCAPELVCLPVTIDDAEDNVVSVTTTLGTYDPETGLLCFLPEGGGEYCGTVTVVDSCGLSDTASFCVTIEGGDYAEITCPADFDIDFILCQPQEVCFPLEVAGSGFTVSTNIGTWADNQLCFYADTSGVYTVRVIADAECNVDTCEFDVLVGIQPPVSVTCPGDTSVSLCEPDTLCFEFQESPSVEGLEIIGDAFFSQGTICVPILSGAGEIPVSIIGFGDCGVDTCSFTVTYEMNRPPTITVEDPDPITGCGLASICLPYTAADPDGNIVSVESVGGEVVGDSICYSDLGPGMHRFFVTVTDDCGATDVDTVDIPVQPGPQASIICPTTVPVDTICGPDTICVVAPISPATATVTVSPRGWYNEQTGEVCIPVEQSETIEVTMIASDICGDDTCSFDLTVVRAQPPTVTCPPDLDTLLCFETAHTLCFPVTYGGTGVDLTVTGATYANGEVCLTVDEPGTYEINITAEGYCGTASCVTTVNVAADEQPVLNVPSFMSFERCADDTDLVCFDGIFATDAETTPQVSMVCGAGSFTNIGPDTGGVCFLPDTFGVYTFCFEADDGCHTVYDTVEVEIFERADCDVCVELWIESDECTPVGVAKQARIMISSNAQLGGFELLLSFDPSALTFQSVTVEGSAVGDWEYFTHRLNDVDCGSSPCGSGFLRLIGIAETNNGALHPPESAFEPNGVLATMTYYVKNDQTLGDQFVPIRFYWFDCTDNSFSDRSGNQQLVDLRIYNSEGGLIWDELDEINYPESRRTVWLGTPDECIQPEPDKPSPERCILFQNGGIWICHPDSLDDRGDINLNSVPYEISDAVVFSNYFIYGLSAFTINVAGQTAATDVNADGLTLTVGDLVYLIRVIVGDADPIPRLNPYEEDLRLDALTRTGQVTVTTDAVGEIGGAHLVYRLSDGAVVSNVQPGPDAGSMDLLWRQEGDELRILLYDFGEDYVASGERRIIEIDITDENALQLAKTDFVDYHGRPYRVAARNGVLPGSFALHQNYPNPFNPTTTISFTLPQASEWMMEIYNVNGSLVRSFRGDGEVGTVSVQWDGTESSGSQVASGVYFYRLKAGDFSDTRKMIMLK